MGSKASRCRQSLEGNQRTPVPGTSSRNALQSNPGSRPVIDLTQFYVKDPVQHFDHSFKYSFVANLPDQMGGFSVLVKNEPRVLRKALAAIVFEILRSTAMDKKKIREEIRKVNIAYHRHFSRRAIRWTPWRKKPTQQTQRQEELAYYHYMGDQELRIKVLAKIHSAETVELSIVQEKSLLTPSFRPQWESFAQRLKLDPVPLPRVIRVPSRLVANQKRDFEGLQSFMETLVSRLGANKKDDLLAIKMGIQGVLKEIITEIYSEEIHRQIGLPGRYQDLDKDLSMRIRLGLEKHKGVVTSASDLKGFISDLQAKTEGFVWWSLNQENPEPYLEAVDWEFNHLKAMESEPLSHDIEIPVLDVKTHKAYVLHFGFRYQYRLTPPDQIRIELLDGLGTTNDLYLSIFPDVSKTELLPTALELEQLTQEITSAMEPLLQREKLRTKVIGKR